ncbi:unnamed protein product [Urochloa decumbens]|uniref:Uncharacterized protein n=1 Tax=Urochloa decumbens TaxID=240449 RepID=A0ABC9AJ60_9POAL
MAAERPWKERVLEVVTEAGNICINARNKLNEARGEWQPEMRVDDQQGSRHRIHRLRAFLADAAADLDLAMASMAAAERISLHATATDTRVPLAGIEYIDDDDGDVRHAMYRLQYAELTAERAFDHLQQCRGRLLTAVLLLDSPYLPGVDGLIAAERANAESSFEDGTRMAKNCSAVLTEVCGFLH